MYTTSTHNENTKLVFLMVFTDKVEIGALHKEIKLHFLLLIQNYKQILHK